MKDVYLLSGFLGSGKTSLLTHLIKQLKEQGLKPAVLMNELGALGFDSDAVEQDVPLRELLEGCICCSPAEKTESQLQHILYNEQFDVLLIETTGAAHPVAALDVILSPLFADHFQFKGIVTVVDAFRFLERDKLSIQTRQLYLEQLRHAHLLVINKTDLINPSDLAAVIFSIQQINPYAKLIQTQHAKVNLDQVYDLTLTTRSHQPSRIGMELLLGSKLELLEEPYPQSIIEGWVRSLPDTIYRIKGYVNIPGATHPYLFQYAYGMTQWLQEDIKLKSQVVIIGENVHVIPSVKEFIIMDLVKRIYVSREKVQSANTIDQVTKIIEDELLDLQTHPRTRVSIQHKKALLLEKLQNLDCSIWEEKQFSTWLNNRVSYLSTTSN